jgi:hypothetical protein
MYFINLKILKKSDVSYENPDLWFEGDFQDTSNEYRNVSLLTSCCVDEDSTDTDEFIKTLDNLSNKKHSCFFQSISNSEHCRKSFVSISFYVENKKIKSDIHIELVLTKEEVLTLSQKIDLQKLSNEKRESFLKVKFHDSGYVSFVKKVKQLIDSNQVNDSSYKIPITYYKLIIC